MAFMIRRIDSKIPKIMLANYYTNIYILNRISAKQFWWLFKQWLGLFTEYSLIKTISKMIYRSTISIRVRLFLFIYWMFFASQFLLLRFGGWSFAFWFTFAERSFTFRIIELYPCRTFCWTLIDGNRTRIPWTFLILIIRIK